MNKTPTKLPDEDSYYNKAKEKKDWNIGSLKFVLNFLFEKLQKENRDSILELGCGKAEILDFLLPSFKYTGLDPSERCIAELKLKDTHNNFVVGCAEEVPFPDSSFDFVFSGNAFEHFYDPRRGILEMIRVINPGGYVILVAPNLEVPWAKINGVRHYSLFNKIIFGLERWTDLMLRLFGVLRFRLVEQNYTEATGRYERADDDLMSVTSTYEVVSLFRQKGFKEVFVDRFTPKNGSFKNKLRAVLTHISVLKYYGTGIFVIFQKPNNFGKDIDVI